MALKGGICAFPKACTDVATAIGAALLLHVAVEKPTTGPLKRGVLYALGALQRYVPARVTRWRQDKIQHGGMAGRVPRL